MPDQILRDAFLRASPLEQSQRRQRFPVDLSGFERHHHLRRDLLQFLRPPLFPEEDGEIQRDERGVEAFAEPEELPLHRPVRLFGFVAPAQAVGQDAFRPAEAEEIQRFAERAQEITDFRE